MKTYKKYLLVILTLVVILMIIVIKHQGFRKVTNIPIRELIDMKDIDQISLTKGHNEVQLTQDQELTWSVNNKYKAKNDAIVFLLSTLTRLEVKSPVPGNHLPDILALVNDSNSLQISITDRTGDVTTLTLWEDTIHHSGTCLQVSESDDVYLVFIPGFSGNELTQLFRLDEAYWCDNTLINIAPDKIRTIRLRYYQNQSPDGSFCIQVISPDSIRLETLSGVTLDNVEKEQLFTYLLNFSSIQSYDASNLLSEEQSKQIISNFHLASIEIITSDGNKYVIDAFLKPLDNPVGNDKFDPNNLYVTRDQDNQLVIVSYTDFDLIMRDLESFSKK